MVEIQIEWFVYGLVGLGIATVGLHKFTDIFKSKCHIDSCPDPECRGTVDGLVMDVGEMKPQLLDVQQNTAHIKGQVDILVQQMVQK